MGRILLSFFVLSERDPHSFGPAEKQRARPDARCPSLNATVSKGLLFSRGLNTGSAIRRKTRQTTGFRGIIHVKPLRKTFGFTGYMPKDIKDFKKC
ncbi:hypothetical protein C0U40_07980 [Amylibacter cionae]|nr:hypothetical protein C0U40_07980 [Amylibacter cionae]